MPSSYLSPLLSSIANLKNPESPMWLIVIWTLFLQFCSVSYQSRSIKKLKTQSCPADPCGSSKAAVICLFAVLAWITLAVVGIGTYLAMNDSIDWSARGKIRKPHQPRDCVSPVQGQRSRGENSRTQSVKHNGRNRQAQQKSSKQYGSEEQGPSYSGSDINEQESDHSSTRPGYKGHESRRRRENNRRENGGRSEYHRHENDGRREFNEREDDGQFEYDRHENGDEDFGWQRRENS